MGSNILIAVGALVAIGIFMLSSNVFMNSATKTMIQSEHYITAIGLAQSIIDEAKTKDFDQKVIGKAVIVADSLSAPGSLGYDNAGEALSTDYVDLSTTPAPNQRFYGTTVPSSQTKFNDVDDYNNYTRIVRTPGNGIDTLRCSISYAKITYPDSLVTTRTFCKRLKISITGQYFTDALKLEYAYIY